MLSQSHLPVHACNRFFVCTQGYDMYIRVFYAISAVIIVSIVLAAWLAIVSPRQPQQMGGCLLLFTELACRLRAAHVHTSANGNTIHRPSFNRS